MRPPTLVRVGRAETTPVVVVPPPLWHGCGLRLSALPISPYGETACCLWAALALTPVFCEGGDSRHPHQPLGDSYGPE